MRVARDAVSKRRRAIEAEVPNELGPLLLTVCARVFRLQQESLEALQEPLTLSQYRVLARLSEGHSMVTELATLASRTLPTMSKTVDGMVRRGLVVRVEDPADRRTMRLSLTPAGTRALRAASKELDYLSDRLVDDPSTDRESVMAFLASVHSRAQGFLAA